MLMIKRWTTRYHPTQVQLEILLVCTAQVCHNHNAIFLGINVILYASSVMVQRGPTDSTYILCSLEFPDSYWKYYYILFEVYWVQTILYGFILCYLVEHSGFDALLSSASSCTHFTLSCVYIYIYMFIYLTVYGNTGVTHSDPNVITKRLFPARVREMHRNGNECFEEEFQVRQMLEYL